MARPNSKTERSVQESPLTDAQELDAQELDAQEPVAPEDVSGSDVFESVEDSQDVDSILNSLKTLLSSVEKLQKIRQEVGDIKPLLTRMLDGELVSGEDLEMLKTGVGGLFRLVRAYSDHQAALAKAQSARKLLDEVLRVPGSS
ncbi:MAG: hypothetical protein KME43_18455 [Myxacorys chilensis ATA2-1-KO14]|jgi:hypothetical protein|nr:hypothetical protein [Myxacorys chilensis ATA2-1-KO14]